MTVYFQNQKVQTICQIRDSSCLTKKQKKKKKNPQNKTHQKMCVRQLDTI